MVNKERIRLWRRALMTAVGQTQGALRDDNGRCCLGVACDVYIQNTEDGSWEENDGAYAYQGQYDLLPENVKQWYGLDSCDPELNYMGEEKCASSLNDDNLLSFKEIAKCVKETFLTKE